MENINIGQKIKELRLYKNIKEENFAKKCGIDVELLAKWEASEVVPSAYELHTLSHALNVNMDYFFMKPKFFEERNLTLKECHDNLDSTILLFSEIEMVSAPRRELLWDMIKEFLFNEYINRYDNPLCSIENTTEEQRERVIRDCVDLLGDAYAEYFEGYVKGKYNLSDMTTQINKKRYSLRDEERTVRNSKHKKSVWQIYNQCIEYLENAVTNEFIDLRYADVALRKMEELLKEDVDRKICVLITEVHNDLKVACEKQDEELVKNVLEYFYKCGELIWHQLPE